MAQGVPRHPDVWPKSVHRTPHKLSGSLDPKGGLEKPRFRREPAFYRGLQSPEEPPKGMKQRTYGTSQWLYGLESTQASRAPVGEYVSRSTGDSPNWGGLLLYLKLL